LRTAREAVLWAPWKRGRRLWPRWNSRILVGVPIRCAPPGFNFRRSYAHLKNRLWCCCSVYMDGASAESNPSMCCSGYLPSAVEKGLAANKPRWRAEASQFHELSKDTSKAELQVARSDMRCDSRTPSSRKSGMSSLIDRVNEGLPSTFFSAIGPFERRDDWQVQLPRDDVTKTPITSAAGRLQFRLSPGARSHGRSLLNGYMDSDEGSLVFAPVASIASTFLTRLAISKTEPTTPIFLAGLDNSDMCDFSGSFNARRSEARQVHIVRLTRS